MVVAPADLSQPGAPWIEVSSAAEVEAALVWENERRFRQAEGTPPLTPPIFTLLGSNADTATAQAVLDGHAVFPPSCDPVAHELLSNHLRFPQELQDAVTPARVSVEVHKQGWRKAQAFGSRILLQDARTIRSPNWT